MNREQTTNGEESGRSSEHRPVSPFRPVAIRRKRLERTLSPWVQRYLGPPHAGERRGAAIAARRLDPPVAGSARRLVLRVQRTVDRARIWKPNVDLTRSRQVEQFATQVTHRFQGPHLVSARRQPAATPIGWDEQLDLTLAQGGGASEEEAIRRPAGPAQPGFLTVGQRITPMAPEARAPRAAPSRPKRPQPARRPSPVQRSAPPAGSRLFSRVEEISSGGAAPPVEQPVEPAPPPDEALPEDFEAIAPAPQETAAETTLPIEPQPAREPDTSAGPQPAQRPPSREASPPSPSPPSPPDQVRREATPEPEPEEAEPSGAPPAETPPIQPDIPLPSPPETKPPVERMAPPKRRPRPAIRPAPPAAKPPPVQREVAARETAARPEAAPVESESEPDPEPSEPDELPLVQRQAAPDVPPPTEPAPDGGPAPPEVEPEPPAAPQLATPPPQTKPVQDQVPPRPEPAREAPPIQRETPPRVESTQEAGPVEADPATEVAAKAVEEPPAAPPVMELPLRQRPRRQVDQVEAPAAKPPAEPSTPPPPLQRQLEAPPTPPPEKGPSPKAGAPSPTPEPARIRLTGQRRVVLRQPLRLARRPSRQRPDSTPTHQLPLTRSTETVRATPITHRREARPPLPLLARSPDRYVGPDISLPVLRPGAPRRDRVAPIPPGSLPPLARLRTMIEQQRIQRREQLVLPPVPRARPETSRQERVVRATPAAQPGVAQQPAQRAQPTPQAPPVELIQRQPVPEPAPIEVSEVPVAQATIVQRAEADDEDRDVDLEEADLTQLAQQVFPFVKRLLAIERERRSARA